MNWIFDGVGTAIITFILGLFAGGGAGYKIAITVNRKNVKQKQNARDNANQIQIGEIHGNEKTKCRR